MSVEVLELYRNLALGSVGMIISGGFSVYRARFTDEDPETPALSFETLRVNILGWMVEVVHQAQPTCKITAQLDVGSMDAGPSPIVTYFSKDPLSELPLEKI